MIDRMPPNVRHWFDPAVADQVQAFFAGRDYDLVFLGDLVSVPYAEQAGLDLTHSWIDRARVDIAFQTQRDATQPAASAIGRASALCAAC